MPTRAASTASAGRCSSWSDALLAEESAALLAVDGPAPENGGDETRIVGRHRTRRFRNSAPPVSSSLVPGGS